MSGRHPAPVLRFRAMDENQTPRRGQVYASDEGEPMLYLRTEERTAGKPEHVFAVVRQRMVYERWVPAIPEEWGLVIDSAAADRAEELENLLSHEQRHTEALVAAMKEAMAVLPAAEADLLREVYRQAMVRGA